MKILEKTKYFNFQKWLDYLELSKEKSFFVIINSVRNTGKSTSVWNWVENEIWLKSDYKWKVAYWRTNLTKLKKQIESFNALYSGKYLMTENRIYKITLDDSGKELKHLREEIGAVMGLNNYENYKSNWFNEFHCIFWDEYNEVYQKNIWTAFIDLWKTVKRANDPFYTILCGNNANANCDIMVNLEIDIPPNPEQDYIQWIDKDAVFVAVGSKTYDQIESNSPNDIVHRIASKCSTTNRYLNEGGHLQERSKLIKLWKYIEPDYEPVRNISFRGVIYEEGVFGENDNIYIRIVDNPDHNIPMVALDGIGWMQNPQSISWTDIDFYENWARGLKYAIKNQSLFFTSNDCMVALLDYITLQTNLIE